MRALSLSALSLLPLLASPMAMAGSFTPPEGCTTFLTVQAKQCRVSNHYTCTADAKGDQWRADFGQNGPFFLSRINAEGEWVESFDLGGELVHQTLVEGAEDPASFSDLLAQGHDAYAFQLQRQPGDGSSVTGFDTLTGRTVTIDGVALGETRFEYTERDTSGAIIRQSRGFEYIHPELRLFFSGPSEWRSGDETFEHSDGSPVAFIFPDEAGFASTEPVFDCDPLMMRFTPSQKESSHDHL